MDRYWMIWMRWRSRSLKPTEYKYILNFYENPNTTYHWIFHLNAKCVTKLQQKFPMRSPINLSKKYFLHISTTRIQIYFSCLYIWLTINTGSKFGKNWICLLCQFVGTQTTETTLVISWLAFCIKKRSILRSMYVSNGVHILVLLHSVPLVAHIVVYYWIW